MTWRRSILEAAIVTVAAAVTALLVNAVRPDGLPLVAAKPYRVLVPCPEPGGPVQPLAADDRSLMSSGTFLVDARPAADFALGHLEGAVNLPYDWLDPLPEGRLEELARAIAASGASRVAVYGDGGRPDSGEHLGREISGRGIKSVFFIVGGAPALFEEPSP
jgi:hypothetical protein